MSDGHGGTVEQDVTVTIAGTNDGVNNAPEIVAGLTTATGGVKEDTNVDNVSGNIAATGTIVFADVDLIDTHTASFVLKSSDAAANLPGFAGGTGQNVAHIGTFAIDSAVTEDNTDTINTGTLGWNSTLADNDPVLQSLAAGQTITQVYAVTIKDNNNATVTQDVTVTITGVNDGPTIVAGSTTPTGGVTEDTAVSVGNVATAGTIAFQDLDLIDTHTASFVLKSSDAAANLPGFAEGTGPAVAHIGTFAIDGTVTENNSDTVNTGSLGWSFTLADNDPVLQSLAAGQTITQVYAVTIKDNNNATVTQDVTVTITGVNDGPTIVAGSTTPTGGVTEDTAVSVGNVATAGTIAFQDLDLIDTHTASARR